MKLSKKIIFSFIGIVLMLVLTTTGYSFFEDVYLIKDGETFYKDVPEAKSSPLGAANYFHIFANKANLRNHTNGNVATRELSGDSNFGTQNIQEMEYNYAQQVKNINGASGITGHTKMVFGRDVRIDLSEFNRPKVNGKQMDRISGNDIYQDKAPNVYIDFDAEFQKLNNVSKSIIDHEVDRTYSSADFPDRNIRVIDASEFNKKDVYIKLTSDVLQTGTPITIAGLEKNSGDGQFKNVYITVDTGNQSSYTMDSQIKFRYTDGSERGNKETIDFSDSTVLWNFEQYGSPFSGSINLRSTWVGSMLAPKASVGGEQNIDGNIIANEFRGAGETHSWHWQKNKGGVVLEKTDSEDGAFLSGAEFSLYNAETKKLVKEGLTTNADGQLEVKDLPLGKYYFKETKAPVGYELSKKEYPFEITANKLSEVETVTATNKKEVKLGSVILKKVDSKESEVTLSGAEFSLYNAETKELLKEGLTTNADGQLEVKDLPLGKYYFKETKAPVGYELSKKEYQFEITADKLSEVETIIASNQKEVVYGAVTLRKVDYTNKDILLKGAQFALYNAETNELLREKIETTDSGEITLSKLIPGKYYVKETKAPIGYELSTKDYPFEIKANEISKIGLLTITNEKSRIPKSGSVILEKVDEAQSDKKLVGAEFTLYTEEGEVLQTGLTTDENGQLRVDDLLEGNYYFVETKAPDGYELSEEPYSFNVKAGKESNITRLKVTNKAKESVGSVVLEKVDEAQSNKKLPGAEFSLYTSDGEMIQSSLVTNEAGILQVDNLKAGSYYFVETKAPTGYSTTSAKQSFDIKEGEVAEVAQVRVTNQAIAYKGSVMLTKTDNIDETKKLSGAEFTLYKESGEIVQDGLVTDATGVLRYDNLSEGAYYFVETKAPVGYSLSQEKHSFEIKANEMSEVTQVYATNAAEAKEPTGSVELTKVDELNQSQVLKGAEFALYDANGRIFNEKLTTNEKGMLRVDGLKLGNYYFKETKAPIGYQLSQEVFNFEIKANDTAKVVQVKATNQAEIKLGSVELTKVDSANKQKVLKDAEFALYNKTGIPINDNLVTDDQGKIHVENLAAGDYYFVETKAPAGYKLSKNIYEFKIIANETSKVIQVEATNEAEDEEIKLGSVELTKIDSIDKENVLKGAEFNLYKEGTIKPIQTKLVTNDKGKLQVRNLEIGNYYFKETKAPIGYQLSSKHYTFEIKTDEISEVVQVMATNEKVKELGSVELTKVDFKDKTNVLKDAEFSLFNSKGKLLKEKLTTDNNGKLRVDNLTVGSYYFEETKAPKGYQIDKSKHVFDIKKNTISKLVSLQVTNKKIGYLGSVELTKVDGVDKNKVLEGAEFSLYTSDGKLLQEKLTTNKDGKLVVAKLKLGSYYFKETKAPQGYKLSTDNHLFEIKANETSPVEKIVVTNTKIPGTPSKPNPTTKTTIKKILPKTGEELHEFFVYGWSALLGCVFLFWKKRQSNQDIE